MSDVFSKKKRSEVMSKIRYKDTKIELKLKKAVSHAKLRGYRLNYKMAGKPDLVFTTYKVAIFCDGEFWHGKYYAQKKHKYKKYWIEKINYNIQRDKKNNRKLRRDGWSVLRFWEKDIEKKVDKCIRKIKNKLKERGYKIKSTGGDNTNKK